jgi:hypothetical protein
MPRLH